MSQTQPWRQCKEGNVRHWTLHWVSRVQDPSLVPETDRNRKEGKTGGTAQGRRSVGASSRTGGDEAERDAERRHAGIVRLHLHVFPIKFRTRYDT